MSNSLPLFPVWLVDMLGSALMIIISFVCVRYAQLLRRTDRDNVIWTYLLWLSLALALFSVSRSVGHIAKRLLLLSGQSDIWVELRPFSGSINSLTFVIVGSITLFFQRVHRINLQILSDKRAIEKVIWKKWCDSEPRNSVSPRRSTDVYLKDLWTLSWFLTWKADFWT